MSERLSPAEVAFFHREKRSPPGEPDPLARSSRIRAATTPQVARGLPVSRRAWSPTVANLAGPRYPRYAAGARMTEMFGFLPLGTGQVRSVATTSYDGDRDRVPDVAEIGTYLATALTELVEVGGAAADAVPAGPSGARRRQERP